MANPSSDWAPKSNTRKRTFSEAGIDSEEEEVKLKHAKNAKVLGAELGRVSEKSQPSPLRKAGSLIAASPADSGYEISAVNTPASSKQFHFTQPASSGYTSDSDCGTPVVGQRTPGPFSQDFIPKGKRTIAPFNPQNLRAFIQRKFVLLKDEIEPSGIADTLNADGIILDRDLEMIREAKYRVEKCDIFLKAIAKSTLKNDIHIPRKVISAFEKEGYGHLFKDLQHEKVAAMIRLKESFPTKDEIKSRLYINSAELEDEIDPILIIDDLVVEEVLSLDEHEDIKQTNFKPDKVRNLIRYLLRKPEKDFIAFCNVLEKHYQPLAELLKTGAPGPMALGKKTLIDVTFLQKPCETFFSRQSGVKGLNESTEIKLCFVGDGKEEERMIVEESDANFEIQEEAMEIGFDINKIKFSSIVINLTSMSRQSQMELLKKCRESPQFLKKWIQKLVRGKHTHLLTEKKINKMTFSIKLGFPTLEERTCSCKLTKEVIVQHYSSMEKNMDSVDSIIKTFGEFEGFDEATRDIFNKLLAKEAVGNKTENFLRKLLELPDTRLHLCLLEREMLKTNPKLLQKLTEISSTDTEIKLSAADIRKNMNYLVEELEPRHFRDMLTGLEGSEHIVEKIMSTDPRKERCRDLLNFILQKRNPAIEMFVQELQRNNKTHILEFLNSSKKDEGGTRLKEALVNNYKHLVNEIEPKSLRQIFVERREIKAKEFDLLCRMATRRQRAIRLMKIILNENGSVWKCFLDALELAGYRHLASLIRTDIDSYKDCPRIYQSLLSGNNEVQIDGELLMKFREGDAKESSLQVFLHRMIYKSDKQGKENKQQMEEPEEEENENESPTQESLVKRLRTSQWIEMQQCDRKRERNDYNDCDEPKRKKSWCPEVAYAIRDVSPASSPTFGMIRQGDMADSCSSGRFTRSLSRGSEEKPLYEDISPPSSPSSGSRDKPHVLIEAPCSPLQMFESRRRNSLSDGSSHTSSLPTSPNTFRESQTNILSVHREHFRSRLATWSLTRSNHVDSFIACLLRKNKSTEF